MKKLLLLATCLYFFLAPLTYHPDNKLVLYWSGLEHGNVWDIWSYGAKHFNKNSQYNYPPIHYYLDKIQYFIAVPIAGSGFDDWLASEYQSDAYQPRLSRYSLAIKTSLIFASLAVAWLIILIAKQKGLSERQSLVAAGLWLFNPITLYSIPIMGQNDVLAILFFLAGWYVLSKRAWLSAIFFGAAASIKLYPFLWLLLLLSADKSMPLKKKMRLFVGSVGVFILTLLPFISNPVFRSAVFGSSMNERFLASGIEIGYAEVAMIVPILLMVLFYGVLQKASSQPFSLQLVSIMTASLILLGFSHFHVQWYTWVLPFWALWMVLDENEFSKKLLISLSAIVAWLVVLLLFSDASLSTGIFFPLGSNLANVPIIRDMLMKVGTGALTFNNLAHTYLAGIACLAIIYIFQIVVEKVPKLNSAFHFGIFDKFTEMPKLLRFLSVIFVAFSFVLITTFVVHSIPAPRSSIAPQNVGYRATQLPHTQTFESVLDELYYIELYFKNAANQDDQDYLLTIIKTDGELVLSQNFNGYNVGDPSKLRFNIPPNNNLKGQKYVLKVEMVDPNQKPGIDIGYDQGDREMAIQTFYRAPRSLSAISAEAYASLKQVLLINWLLFLILMIALFIVI